MRAMTITNRYQQIRHSGRLTLVAGVAACALVAPAGAAAMADYPVSSGPESSPSSSEFSSVTSLVPPSSEPSASAQSDYSTVSSITGSDVVRPEPVTVSSPSSGDGFDWSDAGIGALVAGALSALAAAGIMVGRRHSTLSPQA